MRLSIATALVLLLAGGSATAYEYTPNPPEPDRSPSIGDVGVLQYAGVACNSVELYQIGVGESKPGNFETIVNALEAGNCTPEDEENLAYQVVGIGPIEEDFTGCKLIYMTTIETEQYGTLYVSSDDIPGITQEQIRYRVDCLKKLRDR